MTTLPLPVLIQGDARNLPLPDESVDLIVTSPPYFGLRDYGTDRQIGAEATPREFLEALLECTREMVRVLKPSGSIFVNLGDKYSTGNSGQSGLAELGKRYRGGGHADGKAKRPSSAVRGLPPKSLLLLPERYRIAAVDELGLIARAVIVWSKPNGLPESVTDRVRRSHEDWVHLTKSPRYFAAVDEIREEYLHPDHHQIGKTVRSSVASDGYLAATGEAGVDAKRQLTAAKTTHPLGKLPGSVWQIATQPLRVPAELGVDHFAAFPMEWPRRLILGWSPEGGTVLDPFGGTGTTALVAAMHGRKGISVDLNPDYLRLATWRCSDPKERARAAGLDPDRVAAIKPAGDQQTDIFELMSEEATA